MEQLLQLIREKVSFADTNRIEKIAQVNWQRVTEAIEAGSTNQGVRSFWLEVKLSLELLLDVKDESEEIYRNIYKLFQQLKYRLKTVKSTINWVEREFPSYSLIEDYERLEVISRFEEDFNSFTNCIVKQYLAGEFFAVREALKSKEEQCNNYLNTLEAIFQLPNRLYEQIEVEEETLKFILKNNP